MRYFFANGFNPSPHPPKMRRHRYNEIHFSRIAGETRQERTTRYQEANVEVPKLGETIFLQRPGIGRISVFVHGAYDAFIMVVASSQRKAYLLANALRAAVTCFLGDPPLEQYSGYLLELRKKPSQDMARREIADLINLPLSRARDENLILEQELASGAGINHIQLSQTCNIVARAINHPRLLDALMHLEYSRTLVWGLMVGSFYDSHYSRDRQELTRYQLEHSYLENRFRYDSAFLSAFRGLECVLGKAGFRRSDISRLLAKTDREFGTSFSMSKHRAWHEMFSSRRKWWKHEDIISYYLELRNSVSAHGNPSPPHIVMEDQVFEIQYLLQSMLGDILIPEEDEGTEPTDSADSELTQRKWTPKHKEKEVSKWQE